MTRDLLTQVKSQSTVHTRYMRAMMWTRSDQRIKGKVVKLFYLIFQFHLTLYRLEHIQYYIVSSIGIPNYDNEWGLSLDIHEPDDEIPYWFSVTVDLDKDGEEDSSMQVSQIKLNGNVAQVRIEVTHFTHFYLISN